MSPNCVVITTSPRFGWYAFDEAESGVPAASMVSVTTGPAAVAMSAWRLPPDCRTLLTVVFGSVVERSSNSGW
jgi:hypothetical protein